MKTKLPHLLTFAALLAFPALTQAQTITSAVPGTISYQGRVLTANGQPVGAGTPVNRTVIFRIWDSPSNTLDANLLYSEAQTVTIAEGEFSVLVGTGAANPTQTFGYSETAKGPPTVSLANVFNGSARFLGVTVAAGADINTADNEITPRQQIVSSAFSFRSRFAENLGTSTSTALTTVDSGHVGIGNTNPPSLFTITGANTSTSTSTPQMVITADDVTERLRLGVDSTGTGTGFIQSFKEGTGAQNLLLNPSGGNVGIGNTAPTARLDVMGGIKAAGASGYTFNTGDLDGGLFSPADGVVTLRTNNTERLRVDGSGNVGIGTTNPVYRLQVTGGNAVISGAAAADSLGWVGVTNTGVERFGLGFAGTAGSWSADAAVGDAVLRGSTGKLLLQSGSGASAICINTSNNVGICTSAPTENLTIATNTNNATATAKLGLSANGGHKWVMESVSGFGGGFGSAAAASFQLYNTVTSNIGLTILSSGNVGIGISNPGVRLDVNGASQSHSVELRANGTTPHIDFSSNTTTDYHARIIWQGTTANRLDFDAPRFHFTGGRIGVGTTSPTCPLDVRGGTDVILNGNYTSIRSEWFVQAFGYGTMSDQRIKQIVDRSSPVSDLETVMKLKVTNYQMKAQIMKGNPVHKGLIAQEVEEVIPEAVLKSEAYVPEIIELAKSAEYDSASKSLKVAMSKPHGLAVGDMVMITSKDTETDQSHYLRVTQVMDAATFVVGDLAAEIKKVFVYGKQVKDFRSVDYNRIYTTGIGAIQQIKKEKDAEVKALKDENAELRARVEALEATAKAREEADKSIVTKLAALERLVKTAAKVEAKPVSLKESAGGAE